jgi:hypothetical protein
LMISAKVKVNSMMVTPILLIFELNFTSLRL